MNLLKRIFLSIRNYFKAETEKVVLQQKTCHHCASRGVFIYPEIKKDEKKK